MKTFAQQKAAKDWIIVDNFAGGGGVSVGIEWATGHPVDVAINHDPAAISMHRANHPHTKHYCENIWEVDPREVAQGKKVALAWFSPDCKHHSKARGGKPRDKNIRGLAWVAVRWAKLVHPVVIILENVEEFQTWGPLLDNGQPDPERKGETFRGFIRSLEKLGYKVEFRELRACDYGAPTTRKRFFLIARCDGRNIVWPEQTHGDPNSLEVLSGLKKPWRTATEIIDWSIPCPSIFDRKRPLVENTMKRIAKGLKKFVFDNQNPFIIKVSHTASEGFRGQSLDDPLQTIAEKNGWGLVTPYIVSLGHTSNTDRSNSVENPITTVVSKAEHMIVTPFLASYHSETAAHEVRGQMVETPLHTIDASNRHALVTSHLIKLRKGSIGSLVTDPVHTITSGGLHIGEVRAFLLKYYGTDVGSSIDDPVHTVTTKDRFALVTVQGVQYQLVDIGMRMLEPRELFNAQGFPEDYIIDVDDKGNKYPKAAQVARCGNSVPPILATVLVKANLPECCEAIEREAVNM